MPIKITIKYYYTPTRMTKIKRPTWQSVDKDIEQRVRSCFTGGKPAGNLYYGQSVLFLKPSNPTAGIQSKETHCWVQISSIVKVNLVSKEHEPLQGEICREIKTMARFPQFSHRGWDYVVGEKDVFQAPSILAKTQAALWEPRLWLGAQRDGHS